MPAKKNSLSQVKSNSPQPGSGWFSGETGTVILCIVLAGIFIACTYAAWQNIGPRVLSSPDYFLGPQQIEITPPPPWIVRSDLAAEVYRDLGRQGPLRIMDENLTERVAAAFSGHPWVAKVQQVTKYHPARVKIDLIYRRPVCMVEIPGGLMPVDDEAVLLPTRAIFLRSRRPSIRAWLELTAVRCRRRAVAFGAIAAWLEAWKSPLCCCALEKLKLQHIIPLALSLLPMPAKREFLRQCLVILGSIISQSLPETEG